MKYCRHILVLLALGCAEAQPPTVAKLRPQGYVNDFAGVLDAASKQRIERLCGSLERSTQTQLAVVTLPTLGGEPIEEFTNQLFRAWGVGRKENKGAMLLLAVQDRRQRLEVGYGLEPLLPDGYAGSILRIMRPALGQGQYGQALYAGTRTLALRVAEKSGVRLDDPGPVRTVRSQPTWSYYATWRARFVLLLLFGILAIHILRSLFGRRGGPPFISTWVGPRYGGWSAGGFGGYDSGGGGGFGGFGGGDSGGGGASSDW